MKVYTSYFANLKKIPEAIVPIAICGSVPPWFRGLTYKRLAPKYDFFMEWKQSTAPDKNDRYIECFNEQVLAQNDVKTVLKELEYKGCGKDVVLLCYEKPSDFCHRHLVSKWFNEHGIECSELSNKRV